MTPPRPDQLRFACALAVTLLLACAPGAAAHGKSKAKQPVLSGYAVQGLRAYAAMQQSFYVRGTGLYRGAPEYSFLWPFSQALAATVSLAHIPGQRSKFAGNLRELMVGLGLYLGPPGGEESVGPGVELPSEAQGSGEVTGSGEGAAPGEAAAQAGQAVARGARATGTTAVSALRSYDGNVAPPVGPGGTSYYDDNEWVGIELARVYELDHNFAALGQAEQIMAFVMDGWQTTSPEGEPLPCPGGVPFSNAKRNTDRNTVTNGPGAELALQLYRITHEARYLQFAEMAYAWVRECLLEPNGLYADHITLTGSVQRTLWSYNQGSMIGAGTLLYQATHNGAYLYQARQTAKVALAYYTYTRLSAENPFFVAVYLRNLMYLDSVTHDPPGSLPAREYAYYAWQRHRLSDNLFVYGSPPTAELLGQAALVQIYALLSTPPATYF